MPPEVRDVRSGDVSTGDLVDGEGPGDLLFARRATSRLELEFEPAAFRATLDRCARSARVLTSDRRGTGVSDRVRDVPAERIARKPGGLAASGGARVASLAGPGDVLVPSTVKELVAGSGPAFDERGEHRPRGVPGRGRRYAVAAA